MPVVDHVDATVENTLAQAEQLAAVGDHRSAVDLVAAVNRSAPDRALQEALVTLRHVAMGPATADRGPSPDRPWPPSAPEGDLGPGLPETTTDGLTVELLTSALAHRGFLLVRGLIPRDRAEELADDARTALDRAADLTGQDEDSPWFRPFAADPSYRFGPMERAFARYGDSLLTAESPLMLARVVDALTDAGLGPLLESYFGEWPVLSVKKSTLRSANPDSLTGWHQDGAFLGLDTRSVNCWVALSPCGTDAPSVDVVPRAFDRILETGTDDAAWSWSIGTPVAACEGGDEIVRPVMQPGDALLFNHLSLHRTGVEPTMSSDRLAIESWFFAPSTYPSGQIPLMF